MSGAGLSDMVEAPSGTVAGGRSAGGDAEPGRLGVADRHVHHALVGVKVDAVVTALVADAAGFDAAEGRAQVPYVVAVEPRHAGLDRPRDPVTSFQVAGPDVRGEAVPGVVG